MIIGLYPLHQLFGQITGAFFLSNNNSKLFSKINLITNILGIVLSYLLISNNKIFNYNLGGVGLAYKILIIQFITSNILFYYICRDLEIKYFQKLIIQLLIPLKLYLFLSFLHTIFLYYSISNFILISFIYIILIFCFFFILKNYNLVKFLK